jgi:hypothetical protein
MHHQKSLLCLHHGEIMPATKPLPKISSKEMETLYERYIAPVAALAETFNIGAHFLDSPQLNALEEYSPNVHIIADVIAWSYLGTLKPLPHNSVMTMLRLLDEGAKLSLICIMRVGNNVPRMVVLTSILISLGLFHLSGSARMELCTREEAA